MGESWIDKMRDHQESAGYALQPKRDLVAEAIERTREKIAACFSDIPPHSRPPESLTG